MRERGMDRILLAVGRTPATGGCVGVTTVAPAALPLASIAPAVAAPASGRGSFSGARARVGAASATLGGM
jgi:hypothetical protein